MTRGEAMVAAGAREADVDALVELRAAMFVEFGAEHGLVAAPEWRREAAAWFQAALRSPDVRVAVVRREGRVIACGVAQLRRDIPAPRNPSGRIAYVSAVMTVEDARGHGCARAVMEDLDDWAVQVGAGRLELFATHQGRPLYESMGYAVHGEPSMRRRLG